MEKTDQQIYDEFASQLCRWGEDGTAPGMGNQDISYGLSQQRKRLEKYHAKIEYRLKQRIGRPEQAASAVFSDVSYTNKLFLVLTTIFTMGVTAVFGYFALSIRLLARVMKDAVKQAPRVAGQLQVKKKLTDIMKPFDPGFTFEYFFCKVQALLKIYIFTDDRNNLAIYEGEPDECGFDNIIDAQFEGAISLNGSRIEGNYCYLDLNVYMTDVYCQGDRLSRRADTFRVGLCRNISRPADYGFSIRQVSCKSCGASFDATRELFCPYCKSRYELREDDWVITYIRKR